MPHLNIKDEETHALANELARRRGISAAAAVKTALRQLLDAERAPPTPLSEAEITAKVEATMTWLRKTSKVWPQDKSSTELLDELYDDDGLPI